MKNILSLKDVTSIPGVQITMDSYKERAIVVEHGDKTIKFKALCDGIYYHDVGSDNSTISKNTVNDYTMVQTVIYQRRD